MSNLQTPFRYDFVGSFLRPQALKDAKAAYQAGEISKEEMCLRDRGREAGADSCAEMLSVHEPLQAGGNEILHLAGID